MQKSYAALAIVSFAVGFAVYSLKPSIFTDLSNLANEAGAIFQNGLGQVSAWWSGIPELGRTLIVAGIPTLFTVFFAWTKSRALTKLQQTERLAQQRIGGLQEQLSGLTDTSAENLRLKTRIETLENSDLLGEATSQVSSLRTINTNLETQLGRMTLEHQAEIRALQDTIDQLQRKTITVVK